MTGVYGVGHQVAMQDDEVEPTEEEYLTLRK